MGIGISSFYKAIWNLNCHYVFLDVMFRHILDIISIKKNFSPCNPKARRKIKKKIWENRDQLPDAVISSLRISSVMNHVYFAISDYI